MKGLDLFRDHLASIIAEEISIAPDASACEHCGRPFDGIDSLVLDQSPRARAIRTLTRIAERYAWGRPAIVEWLDTVRARSLSELTSDQLSELLERMNEFCEAADTACDLADAPPAR